MNVNDVDFAGCDLLEKLVKSRAEDRDLSFDDIILEIKLDFDRMGPYHFAKREGLLVNGSGADFACQFMGFCNVHLGYQAY